MSQKCKKISSLVKTTLQQEKFQKLQPKRRVLFDTPVYALSYSQDRPHLLAVAEERGDLHIVDTEAKIQSKNPTLLDKMQTMDYYYNLSHNSYQKEKNPLILPMRSTIAHLNSIYDLIWTDGGHKIATASSDMSCSIFDAERGECIYSYKNHAASVKCVRENEVMSGVFASGARDGGLHIWDTRESDKKSPVTFFNTNSYPKEESSKERGKKLEKVPLKKSVTGLVHYKDKYILSVEDMSNNIKIWDLKERKFCLQVQNSLLKQQRGHTCITKSEKYLAVNGIDNAIALYRIGCLQQPYRQLVGHKSNYYVKCKISPDQRFLCSGSTTSKLLIWSILTGERVLSYEGAHVNDINNVDWSRSADHFLATSSDDCTVALWGQLDDHESISPSDYL